MSKQKGWRRSPMAGIKIALSHGITSVVTARKGTGRSQTSLNIEPPPPPIEPPHDWEEDRSVVLNAVALLGVVPPPPGPFRKAALGSSRRSGQDSREVQCLCLDNYRATTDAWHSRSRSSALCTLYKFCMQRHNTENWKQIFPEKELRGHSPNFHIHVSVSDLNVPTIGLPILLQDNMWTGIGNI